MKLTSRVLKTVAPCVQPPLALTNKPFGNAPIPTPTGRPPDNPLQLRYGLFILDGDSDSNQLYCGHMTATASRRLQLRHDGAED